MITNEGVSFEIDYNLDQFLTEFSALQIQVHCDIKDKHRFTMSVLNNHKLKFSFPVSILNQEFWQVESSFTIKLSHHFKEMRKFLEKNSHPSIKQAIVSPIHVNVKINCGLYNCVFILSHILGNNIFDTNEKGLVIFFFGADTKEQKLLDLLKLSSLNYNLLLECRNIDQFAKIIQNTFIPIQILQQILNDDQMIRTVQVLTFLPTQEFGIFNFMNKNIQSTTQLPQVCIALTCTCDATGFHISIRDAVAYKALNQMPHSDSFNIFVKAFQLKVQRDFTKIEELQQFFSRLVVYGTYFIIIRVDLFEIPHFSTSDRLETFCKQMIQKSFNIRNSIRKESLSKVFTPYMRNFFALLSYKLQDTDDGGSSRESINKVYQYLEKRQEAIINEIRKEADPKEAENKIKYFNMKTLHNDLTLEIHCDTKIVFTSKFVITKDRKTPIQEFNDWSSI